MCQLYNMERFIVGNSYKVRDNAQNPNMILPFWTCFFIRKDDTINALGLNVITQPMSFPDA